MRSYESRKIFLLIHSIKALSQADSPKCILNYCECFCQECLSFLETLGSSFDKFSYIHGSLEIFFVGRLFPYKAQQTLRKKNKCMLSYYFSPLIPKHTYHFMYSVSEARNRREVKAEDLEVEWLLLFEKIFKILNCHVLFFR